MTKYTLSILLAFAIFSCTSSRFAKQAKKYDEAGLYRDAAQMYLQSVLANGKNIDAKMGLQRSGQLLLQEKLDLFKTHYDNRSVKEAVYAYIDAESWYNQVQRVGVSLILPAENKVYYEEMKEKYLASRYSEGLQALDVEEFHGAETVFSEIISIDQAYKDSKTHWITAKYEPMYRRGVSELQGQLFRRAYYTFDEILKGTNGYKESLNLKGQALEKATITIAVAPFYYPYSTYGLTTNTLQTKVIGELNQLKVPFYKIVNDELILSLPSGGKKSQVNELLRFISTYSQSITSRTVLTGRVSRYLDQPGSLTPVEKRGYVKREKEVVDPVTNEKKKVTVYNKVRYHELTQTNQVVITFDFALIDVKTGQIIVSDALDVVKADAIHYANYDGESNQLIPGYWKSSDKKSEEDVVYNSSSKITELQNLLHASREIKTTQALTADAIMEIAKGVASRIEKYDPEKQP